VTALLALAWFAGSPLAVAPASVTSWIEVRAADRIATHLDELAVPVASPLAVWPAPAHLSVVTVRVRSKPPDPEEASTIHIEATLDRIAVREETRADALDTAAVRVARALASTQARHHADASSLIDVLPWPTERLLGKARALELQGEFLRARLMYERAARVGKRVSMEALSGRARCLPAGAPRRDDELSRAAATRARVAARNGNLEAARSAWLSFLKFTPHRGRSFDLFLPTEGLQWRGANAAGLWGSQRQEMLHLDWKETVRLSRHPGRLRAVGPSFLVVGEQTIGRIDGPRKAPRWTLDRTADQVVVEGGQVGLREPTRVTWVDPTLGKVRVQRPVERTLSMGPRGALVLVPEGVGLIRPGQEVPAWTVASSSPPDQGIVTADRVLLRSGTQLAILRARDGHRLAEVEVPGPLIHAEARMAVASAGAAVVVVDVLAAEVVRSFTGPSRLVAASPRASGVTLGFESGDLRLLDERGEIDLRSRLPFRIRGLACSELRPSLLLVVSEVGVHGFSDPGRAESSFATGALELARLAHAAGAAEEALHLAGWVARRGFGHATEAERLRVELLSPGPAQDYARERSASTASAPLLPFAALGPGMAHAVDAKR
jgi:hypothetical protein